MKLSNTFFLEKFKNWRGLLAEPAMIWQEDLRKLRTCSIDNRCVYSASGEQVLFIETEDPELGTISSYANLDDRGQARANGGKYFVETISLMDLFKFHHVPNYVDYLSIDTEGSEFEILRDFDFSLYEFGLISVEHNFTSNRELLFRLLTSAGYIRVLTEISSQDDWYVNTAARDFFN